MEFGKQLKRKYEAIILRSFNTKLDVFLFYKCLKNLFTENFSHEEFHHFEITDPVLSQYEKAWQLPEDGRLSDNGPQMIEIDNFILNWHKQNPKLKDILLNEYKALFRSEYFPFPDFNKLFDQDPSNRVCYYCKITDKDIELLRRQRKIKTKQLRGYSMELDRINSNREYRSDNVVLACYWCNNAKTDEFTTKEFLNHVGPGIGKVWEERNA